MINREDYYVSSHFLIETYVLIVSKWFVIVRFRMSTERGESIQPSGVSVNLGAEEHADKKAGLPLNQIPSLNRTTGRLQILCCLVLI